MIEKKGGHRQVRKVQNNDMKLQRSIMFIALVGQCIFRPLVICIELDRSSIAISKKFYRYFYLIGANFPSKSRDTNPIEKSLVNIGELT
ncbi:hypothetical protein N826_29415 [Skermanella aerolata KACC 11604]|nr:hypothetical protein N826_29415 [Skermanella aerolata KACC 11604]